MADEEKDQKEEKSEKEKGVNNSMASTWQQPQSSSLVHISKISGIIVTVKITCQKCGASIGANVIDEHVSGKRIICRECGWDNTKKYTKGA